jgi:hypothetical protein
MNPGTFMPQELIDKFIDDLWFERDTDTLKTLGLRTVFTGVFRNE